ncbi:MAG TPA: hypothetical protein VK843_17025 [Planctomycetota bacterium]|nr:hypothetical protein [Planctomycetota bacterium]
MIGAGAVGAAAIYGVRTLNNELESTKVSLAAVFRAQGLAGSVPQGISMASQAIADMRQDAKMLPGEFEDLLRIFNTASVPAFASGMNVQEWEKLSSKVMATAKAVSLPMDQAAREFAMLLEGRSGAHNVFGMRLLGLHGDIAKKFNQSSPEARLEKIRVELDKYGESIAHFATTYDAIESTTKDNVKTFIMMASAPLFEKMKGALGDFNQWFDDNRGTVDSWANRIGWKVASAFDRGREFITKWGPLVVDFADTAYTRIAAAWEKAQPAVEKFAAVIERMLQDPNGTIDKLIVLAKLYAGAKVVGAVAGAQNSLTGGIVQGLGVAGQLGLGGITGGAAVGAVKGAAAGGAGMGGFLPSWVAALGTGAGAATAGAGALAVGGAVAADYNKFMVVIEGATAAVESFKREQWNAANETRRRAEVYQRYMGQLGGVSEMTAYYNDKLAMLSANSDEAGAAALRLAYAASTAAAELHSVGARRNTQFTAGMLDPTGTLSTMKMLGDYRDNEAAKKGANKRHPGGGGGTSIQKVDIVVTGNSNPSRVAREVSDELAKLGRNPRSSPYVQNFSNLSKDR